jgi:centromeric protein E
MRPLNSKEHTHKKVWKVLSKYASVAQTTLEGKPLPERIAGRNFFTYDKTFDESSTTYQVYSAIAQPIVTTACTGRNGTIFAYGQTSSGKTYTMQGSGTIEEGSSDDVANGSGGIVHMTARDIFAHIASCPDRVFIVRASFLEIYNEEVRDLLQDYSKGNKVLQIREDPRRGVFVQSKEMIATDANSLLAVLWQGEKSRSFASTAMNERSSRSHTLFRITIESRSRVDENEDDENEETCTGSAVRVSTLNLVDLAGSESVRHTGATGDRQKEGGMINQR